MAHHPTRSVKFCRIQHAQHIHATIAASVSGKTRKNYKASRTVWSVRPSFSLSHLISNAVKCNCAWRTIQHDPCSVVVLRTCSWSRGASRLVPSCVGLYLANTVFITSLLVYHCVVKWPKIIIFVHGLLLASTSVTMVPACLQLRFLRYPSRVVSTVLLGYCYTVTVMVSAFDPRLEVGGLLGALVLVLVVVFGSGGLVVSVLFVKNGPAYITADMSHHPVRCASSRTCRRPPGCTLLRN